MRMVQVCRHSTCPLLSLLLHLYSMLYMHLAWRSVAVDTPCAALFQTQENIFFLGGWHSRAEQFATLRSLITRHTLIAVVGSSGSLIGQRHGADIDKHDVIIRMNSAGFKGHEVDVGSRTDLRIGWSQGMPPKMVNTNPYSRHKRRSDLTPHTLHSAWLPHVHA